MRNLQCLLPHKLRDGLHATRSNRGTKSWNVRSGIEEQYDLDVRIMLLMHRPMPLRNQTNRRNV
jgi:hypothetical protein